MAGVNLAGDGWSHVGTQVVVEEPAIGPSHESFLSAAAAVFCCRRVLASCCGRVLSTSEKESSRLPLCGEHAEVGEVEMRVFGGWIERFGWGCFICFGRLQDCHLSGDCQDCRKDKYEFNKELRKCKCGFPSNDDHDNPLEEFKRFTVRQFWCYLFLAVIGVLAYGLGAFGDYGFGANGLGAYVFVEVNAATVSPSTGLFINEVADKGSTDTCDEEDWIEFYNNQDSDVDLTGFMLTVDAKHDWRARRKED